MVNNTGKLEQIAGCRIDELIHQGVNSLVYKGFRNEGEPKTVILKVLAQEFPTPKRIARFQLEYQLIKELQTPGVIGCYDLTFDTQLNRWVMLLEDFHAHSLDNLHPFKASEDFFKLAQDIVAAIDQVHQRHVVHKDINPSNIVISRANGQIKLIDFGISSRVPRAAHVPANTLQLEGTLAYLSPEQSGRTGRSVSYQSDYYSLGVTFFQLLTGQLPFIAEDVLEMVHSHVAKPAPDPREFVPELSRELAELVLKLLSKNPEDRYQSAFELQADLENCMHDRPVSIQRKPSVPSEFRLPQKLYGREQETELLFKGFERVSKGTSEVVLVGGYTGVGKSTLVKEAYRAIAQHHGFFIDGKFDQLHKSVPYAALLQAFKLLLKQILAQPDEMVNDWRLRLLNSLGGNAQLVTAALPELELIIGEQPAVEALPPHEARNRFALTFQNLVKVFAKPEHPLTIFLDDLQWVDAGSLQLLEGLLTNDAEIALYLIGAYRDNETGPEHPLNVSAQILQQSGVKLTRLELGPLPVEQVELLISEATGADAELVKELARLVYARTEGNPFFINQLLQSLYTDGLFQFDPARGRWNWRTEQVQAHPVSDDIGTFMERKIGQLPKEACRALCLAACIGNRFRLQTLAVLYDSTERDVVEYLWPAVDAGLVVPLDDSYQLLQLNVPGLGQELAAEYRFAHDQIQQAAYAINIDVEKPKLHQQLGELLRLDNQDSLSFEAIDQLNLGRSLIDNQTQRDDLAEANLQAGRLAKSAPAYSAAQAYFDIGLELLYGDAHDNCWTRQYALSLALHTDATESAYLNNDSTRTEKLAAVVQQHAADLLDKIKIYEIQIQAAIASNRLPEAIDIGLSALQLLDIKFPAKPGKAGVMGDFVKTKLALSGKKREQLADLPLVEDPFKLAQRRVLRSITTPAFFTAPNLFPLLIFEQVRRSVKEGTTPESAYAYMLYGVSLCGVAGDIENGYRFGKLALRLAERFNNGELIAKVVYGHYLFIEPWKNHVKTTFAPFQTAYQGALESGDVEFASYLLYIRPVFGYVVGEPLSELADQMTESSAAISALKQQRAKSTLSFRHQAILNLLGEKGTDGSPNTDPGVLTGSVCNEAELLAQYEAAHDRNGIAELHLNKLMLHYLFEDYTAANQAAMRVAPHLDTLIGLIWTVTYHFYRGLTMAAQVPKLRGIPRRQALAVVYASEKKLKGWSKHCPENFLHQYHLLVAERARVNGKFSQAQTHYQRAIEASKDSGYINEMALAYELAAKFYVANNQTQLGSYHMRDAHYAYLRWGASRKVEALEKQYPQMLVEAKTYRQGDTHMPTGSVTTSADRLSTSLDFASVLKAMQVISGEIMLDPLLEKLLTIVIENVGAQRGVLLLPHDGGWQVAATGEVGMEGAIAAGTDEKRVTAQRKISDHLPESVITYVARSAELLVLDSRDSSDLFSRDPYIIKSKPRSALCAPLQQQGNLSGIIYLENQLTEGVFSTDRLRVLELVLGQAAISIENASLYTRQSSSAEAARRFVPLEFLQLIGKENIEDIRLGDQVQLDMTVMFFDIRSFTTMSEHMTPQQNFDFVNSYFEQVCPIIREHSGFVVKFGGDGIMAAFPKKAEDAIDTAVAVLKQLKSYEALHTRDNERNLRVGFGVHAGSMMPGIVGEVERLQCDILSDVVNVSARLEALTKEYGANILVSKEVLSRLEVADVYRVRRLGQTLLKGREQYSEVFEVCDGDSELQQELKMQTRDRFDIGVGLYHEDKYAEASVQFSDVLSTNPDDKAARLYLEQSASLMIKKTSG